MDEELDKLSSLDTVKRLNDVEGFNTPIIAIVNKKSDLVEHYDSYGFKDRLITPIKKDEVDKIIKKFINNI